MKDIAAELSLYPLRQSKLSPAIDEALRILREHGLAFELSSMSTFISGDDETILQAAQEVWLAASARGDIVMHMILSNACPGDRESLPMPTSR
jgi:uncharacterized protein YqgV (UPF0045/DUF77 family)